jgi:hypothetical protein
MIPIIKDGHKNAASIASEGLSIGKNLTQQVIEFPLQAQVGQRGAHGVVDEQRQQPAVVAKCEPHQTIGVFDLGAHRRQPRDHDVELAQRGGDLHLDELDVLRVVEILEIGHVSSPREGMLTRRNTGCGDCGGS